MKLNPILSPTKEQVDAAKKAHPEAEELFTPNGDTVLVVPPNRQKWKRYRTMFMDVKTRGDAGETLLRDCVVWPTPADFDRALDKRPALVETFSGGLMKLAGFSEDAEKKE